VRERRVPGVLEADRLVRPEACPRLQRLPMRYVKRPRPEPMTVDFIALVILIGPLAWPVRWFSAWLRRQIDGLNTDEA
jgi:hypothetical protein